MQEALTGCLPPAKRRAEYTDPEDRKTRKKPSACDPRVHPSEQTCRTTWSLRTEGRLLQSVKSPVNGTSKHSGKVKGAKGLLYYMMGIM